MKPRGDNMGTKISYDAKISSHQLTDFEDEDEDND
jgi:hypothetical protein